MSTREIKPGDTQVINLEDVDVSAVESERKLPPPLPPEVSSPSLPPTPSMAPSMPPPPPKPRTGLYVGLLVGFVVVGVGIGIAAAVALKTKPQATAPSSGVITIPTIEMDDSADAGP